MPPTGQPFCFYTIANNTGDSANGTLSLGYLYTYIDENGQSVVERGTASTGEQNNLPPCPDCSSTYGQAGPAPQPENAQSAEPTEAEPVEPTETSEVEPAEAPATEDDSTEPTDTSVPAPGDDASATSAP